MQGRWKVNRTVDEEDGLTTASHSGEFSHNSP